MNTPWVYEEDQIFIFTKKGGQSHDQLYLVHLYSKN